MPSLAAVEELLGTLAEAAGSLISVLIRGGRRLWLLLRFPLNCEARIGVRSEAGCCVMRRKKRLGFALVVYISRFSLSRDPGRRVKPQLGHGAPLSLS